MNEQVFRGLTRTRFFTDQVAGYRIAGCHSVVDGHAVFAPDLWYLPVADILTAG